MSYICYTLQSSTAVLGVFCNKCDQCCSFAYSSSHSDVAFWTKNKESILCSDCAKDEPNKIYRKVLSTKDIPLDRSYFKSKSRDDNYMFSDNSKNKKNYHYRFCTKEDEEKEFKSGIPKKEKCDCQSKKCPDLINYDLLKQAKDFAKNEFKIICKDINVESNWRDLVANLFHYNYTNEFESDIVQIKIRNDEHDCFRENDSIITKVQIMIGKKFSPWQEETLKGLQERMMKVSEKLSFEVTTRYFYNGAKHDFDGAIEKVVNMNNKNPHVKEDPDIWIYIRPLPFVPLDDKEENLEILFELERKTNHQTSETEKSDAYPSIFDGRINGKEIKTIEAFQCPCVYEKPDAIKKKECKHNVYIYFKDGTHLMYWGGGPKINVEELKTKGYIPYIKQYRPKSNSDYKKQMERCELSKLIGEKNLIFSEF